MPSTTSPKGGAWLLGRSLLAAAALSTVLGGLAAAPASAAPQPSCGSVINYSVTLQADITGCPGDGLVVGASGITIDLNGHLLSGNGADGTGRGIRGAGGSGVTIKNGRIQSFATGIDLSRTFSSTVTGLNLGGDYNGVVLTDSKVSVSGNLIGGNPADSNRGITVISGEGNAVQNNTVKGFQSVGILVGGSSTTVSRNTVSSTVDGDGIVMAAPQAKVTGNTVVASGYDGVFVEPGASGSVTGNTLSNNGDDGMYVHANSGSVVVANNVADYNQEWGIEGSPGVTDGGGNRATGNRNSPPCTYVHCS